MRPHKPLNLDGLSSIRIDGDIPDMEIVRGGENSDAVAESGNCTESCTISNFSDHELDEKIEDYRKHLQKFEMKDGNIKLKLHIQKLEDEKARRSMKLKTGCQLLSIEDGNVSPRLSMFEIQPVFTEPSAMKEPKPGFEERTSAPELRLIRPSPTRIRPSPFLRETCTMSSPDLPGNGNGTRYTTADNVERNPFKVKHEACFSYALPKSASRHLNHVDGDENRTACFQRKKNTFSSFANTSTSMKSESSKEHLCASPREPPGGRIGAIKQRLKAVGETLDTAMELSDDEEKQGDMCHDIVKQPSSHLHIAKRPGLRSAFKRKTGWRVAYPSSDDLEAVEIQYDDLQHLAPSNFLNDTIIDFYIKYIQIEKISSLEKLNHLHFFNTFFYKKLTTEKQVKGNDCFLKLRKWTKGANIFEKSYLFVPIHDSAHWSLAIVCFPWVDDKSSITEPYILHLDSMSSTSGHATLDICNMLKSYLEAEWRYWRHEHDTTNEVLRVEPSKSIHKRVQVPLQDNEWDCGLFMLYYIERFAQEARVPFKPTILDGMFGRLWFKPSEASQLRWLIHKLLESLFDQVDRMS